MSDDEADPELLELLRQSLGISRAPRDEISSDTGVLRNAEFIYSNAIDVSVDMFGTKAAAVEIYQMMRERGYSTETWSEHDLHPKASEGFTELDIVNFVFTMDLQNYSSELSNDERFQVEYRGRRWTGYNSLVACLRRALDEGIPITTPRFWRSQRCTDELLKHVFRSATTEQIPLLEERIAVLRESSIILRENFPGDEEEEYEDDVAVAVGAEEQPSIPVDDSANVPEESQSQDPAGESSLATNSTLQDENFQSTADAEVAEVNGISADVDHLHIAEVSRSEDLPEIDAGSGEASGTASNEPELQNGLDSSHQAAELSEQIDASQGIEPPQPTESSDGSAPERPTETRPTDHQPDHAVVRLIQKSDRSAGKLVNLLAHHFPCFRDETRFEGRRVRLLKRAQIFVADLWAALSRTGLGEFHDIDHLTMFADYRVPQSLHSLGVLIYSPPLDYHIRGLRPIESGHSWEVQLRGCSIWAVELIRREILSRDPAATNINAVLIDFFLYDLAKEKESQGQHAIPHHRTRSIWY